MRRALAAAAVAALVLTGCGETEEPTTAETTSESPESGSADESQSPSGSPSKSPSESPSESPSGSPSESPAGEQPVDDAIEVEIEGDSIEPRGKRVEAAVGETITFRVESDRPAELHVHSSPEQVLQVKQGESTVPLVIDRPGLVEVEEHESGLVLVQLEVR